MVGRRSGHLMEMDGSVGLFTRPLTIPDQALCKQREREATTES